MNTNAREWRRQETDDGLIRSFIRVHWRPFAVKIGVGRLGEFAYPCFGDWFAEAREKKSVRVWAGFRRLTMSARYVRVRIKQTNSYSSMNPITKLALVALVAASGTGVALADNDQNANLREIQRRAAERNDATVAVYTGGQRMQHQYAGESVLRPQVPNEVRRDSHGGFYVAPGSGEAR